MPQMIPLLTMIRVAEDIVAEIQRRHCPPAETYVFQLSLQMWPIFQKGMTEHIESVKKLAEGTSASYFSRASTTTDAAVANVRLTLASFDSKNLPIITDLWTICCIFQFIRLPYGQRVGEHDIHQVRPLAPENYS